MTEREAIEKLKNMRLFMQIMDKDSEHKFVEDDYKANEMAIHALGKQIQLKVLHSYDDSIDDDWCSCPICCSGLGWYHGKHYKYCMNCGQKLDWEDDYE
jgi:hypothetical protein